MDSPEARRLAILEAVREHPKQSAEQLAVHAGITKDEAVGALRWLSTRYLVNTARHPGSRPNSHNVTLAGRAALDLIAAASTVSETAHAEVLVRAELAKTYRADGAEIWLTGKNVSLDLQRPIDLIRNGEGDRVLELAKSLTGGVAT